LAGLVPQETPCAELKPVNLWFIDSIAIPTDRRHETSQQSAWYWPLAA